MGHHDSQALVPHFHPYSKFVADEKDPDLNSIEHLQDELERQVRSRPHLPKSVSVLAGTLVAEREPSQVIEAFGKLSEYAGCCRLVFELGCSRSPHTFRHVVFVVTMLTGSRKVGFWMLKTDVALLSQIFIRNLKTCSTKSRLIRSLKQDPLWC